MSCVSFKISDCRASVSSSVSPGTFGLNLCGFIDRDFIIAYVVTLAVIVIDYSIDTDEHNQYNYEKDGEHINPAEFLLFFPEEWRLSGISSSSSYSFSHNDLFHFLIFRYFSAGYRFII